MEKVFEPTRVITPANQDIPTEGTVGYVHIEDCNYEGQDIKPRIFDMDSYEFELVG